MVVFQLNMNFGEFEWPWTSVLEGTVGVALVLLSTAAVLLFILLCEFEFLLCMFVGSILESFPMSPSHP